MIKNPKSLYDMDASLAVIASNVNAYYAGNLHAYRPVAVELRKLLCDTQGKTNNSLIKRLFPDLRLRPLSVNKNYIKRTTALYIPGQLCFDGRGGSRMIQLFNELAPALLLDDWLQQKIFDFRTTIKSFIRSVADKEGAHSDKSYNTTLRKTKSIFLTNDTIAAKTILSIGCFVIKTLALSMIDDNINEIGAQVINEYKKIGRGGSVLSLTEFATQSLKEISMKYEPASSVKAYFQRDSKKLKAATRILESYQPSKCFMLLLIGFKNEIWLYEHSLK